MDALRLDQEPKLRRPVLICAFEGWNDAADVATGALSFLRSRWQAQRLGVIDPEPFFDFQVRRPRVTLIDGITRKVTWPVCEFLHAPIPGGDRDAILFLGIEPNFRWRSFAELFVDVTRRFEVDLVVTLGALLADVPHSRPTRVIGTAARPEVVERMGLMTSRYEGPTGIVGVVHDAMGTAGLDSVSLWASVPHYVATGPNPKATVGLVKRLGELLGTDVDTAELEVAANSWEARVSEIVAGNSEIADYVHQLETAYDSGGEDPTVPLGNELVSELEKFLRDQEGGGDGQDKSRGPS